MDLHVLSLKRSKIIITRIILELALKKQLADTYLLHPSWRVIVCTTILCHELFIQVIHPNLLVSILLRVVIHFVPSQRSIPCELHSVPPAMITNETPVGLWCILYWSCPLPAWFSALKPQWGSARSIHISTFRGPLYWFPGGPDPSPLAWNPSGACLDYYSFPDSLAWHPSGARFTISIPPSCVSLAWHPRGACLKHWCFTPESKAWNPSGACLVVVSS